MTLCSWATLLFTLFLLNNETKEDESMLINSISFFLLSQGIVNICLYKQITKCAYYDTQNLSVCSVHCNPNCVAILRNKFSVYLSFHIEYIKYMMLIYRNTIYLLLLIPSERYKYSLFLNQISHNIFIGRKYLDLCYFLTCSWFR